MIALLIQEIIKFHQKKIKTKTGFVAKRTIENALTNIKIIFQQKKIKNAENKIYNNLLSLKEND